MQRALRFASAVLPALAFLGILEIGLRLGEWADPELTTLPFREEGSLLRSDPDFFWSLLPNLSGVEMPEGGSVDTNAMGLRSRDLPPKAPGELRILSLGESTTFGVGVSNDETYSARLEEWLTAGDETGRRPLRVINAGVPAWSSFQSLTFLEQKGDEIDPDIVLFYHEVNDYLPSSLRGAGESEIGMAQTDAERHQSRKHRVRQFLQRHLALVRFFDVAYARYRIARFKQANAGVPMASIGLPEFQMTERVRTLEGETPGRDILDEAALPQRVSPSERLENLAALAALCRERGWRLVVIHPSYRLSRPHECILTEFCAREEVAMLEVHEVLHPPALRVEATYLDAWHPTPDGHRRIAEALGRHLSESGALD
jgi:lysophospholipase L1-like esterase